MDLQNIDHKSRQALKQFLMLLYISVHYRVQYASSRRPLCRIECLDATGSRDPIAETGKVSSASISGRKDGSHGVDTCSMRISNMVAEHLSDPVAKGKEFLQDMIYSVQGTGAMTLLAIAGMVTWQYSRRGNLKMKI